MPKKLFLISVLIFFLLPWGIKAQESEVEFNVDQTYDYAGREQVKAFLHNVGSNALFYVETSYYNSLQTEERAEFAAGLKSLANEFDEVIYPGLTKIYGPEWKPGIDQENKITVLVTQIKSDFGGYFNQGDEYPKAQVPISNQREMIYFNVNYVTSKLAKSYLAHEFVHLITFNQKERAFGISEEIWLNEARAELAPTLLGYDDIYQGSNLQRRVATFAEKPDDPLTEWKGSKYDYGALNLFFQYVLDHYGVNILKDSLHSGKTGIESINYALKKNIFLEDFSEIFTNWTIAVLINDCSYGKSYCYLNKNLQHLAVLPQLSYLPLSGESSLTMTDYAKKWSGNWYKLIGGSGTLNLEFNGTKAVNFVVPYVTRDETADYSVGFLQLDKSQQGDVLISGFGGSYKSFFIIPSIQDENAGNSYYYFTWTASIEGSNSDKAEEKRIQELLAQIESLKQEILQMQAKIAAVLAQKGKAVENCSRITENLSFGMADNEQVRCLQQFLKDQGQGIYPEGLITGNFYALTKEAVIRFQEKYREEILSPFGLEKGTGFVGEKTRAKINELI